MTQQELCNLGFISQEHYECARATLASDRTGEFAPAGTFGFAITRAEREDTRRRASNSYRKWNNFAANSRFPSSFSLADSLLPVSDQASRGTCVAHAATALTEYYLESSERLSVQYLYAQMKLIEMKLFSRDLELLRRQKWSETSPDFQYRLQELCRQIGTPPKLIPVEQLCQILENSEVNPNNREGSLLKYAFAALRDSGVCRYDCWPYAQTVIQGNSGQLPVPDGLQDDALSRRIQDKCHLLSAPNSIEEIKSYLCGNATRRPMPVSIGITTFDSWVCNPFTKRTGWFGMPLYDFNNRRVLEESSGGHEMLIVGYQDEPFVPGGGYFIVRNSWAATWAWENEIPGHAKIPYAYANLFINEAGTIIASEKHAAKRKSGTPTAADATAPQPSALAETAPNANAPAGGSQPETTPQSSDALAGESATQEDHTAQNIIHKEDKKEINLAVALNIRFQQDIHSNLTSYGRDYSFPDIGLGWTARLYPGRLRVREVLRRDDLTDLWLDQLTQRNLLAPADREIARRTNSILIYELKSKLVSFLVATAFITPVRQGRILPAVPAEYFPVLQKLFDDAARFAENHYCRHVSGFGRVIGTSGKCPDELLGVFAEGAYEFNIFCRYSEECWNIHFPEKTGRSVWWGFLLHLLPVTLPELAANLEKCIARFRNPETGRRTPEKIMHTWGYPEVLFRRTLAFLLAQGRFRYVDGEILPVDERTAGRRRNSAALLSQPYSAGLPALVKSYGDEIILVTFSTIGFYILIGSQAGNRYKITTILGLALCALVAKSLNAWLARKVFQKGEQHK